MEAGLDTIPRPLNMSAMKDVILTLTGPDATGIVARLATIAESRGGNWLDSRMMRMGGHFSGILRLAVPEEELEVFSTEVSAFMEEIGFQFSLKPDDRVVEAEEGNVANLELSGQDHPGIVRAIFTVFQTHQVNVEELHTGLDIAPWSGTPVFIAQARLRLPVDVTLETLQSGLEELATDLMVELELHES